MTTRIRSPLSTEAQKVAGKALQEALVDMVDISLQAKQAHWNLIGSNFRSLHLELDEMVSTYREYSDSLAERRVAIGLPADGLAQTVAENTKMEPLPTDFIDDSDVVTHFVERLHGLSQRMRERIGKVEKHDLVTQDLLIGMTDGLEKHAWMMQAQLG